MKSTHSSHRTATGPNADFRKENTGRGTEAYVEEQLCLLGTPTRTTGLLAVRRRVDKLREVRLLDVCVILRMVFFIPIDEQRILVDDGFAAAASELP